MLYLILPGIFLGYLLLVSIELGLLRRFKVFGDDDCRIMLSALLPFGLLIVLAAVLGKLLYFMWRPFKLLTDIAHKGLPKKIKLPEARVVEK